jgi:suppressor for copper-sensitivity B
MLAQMHRVVWLSLFTCLACFTSVPLTALGQSKAKSSSSPFGGIGLPNFAAGPTGQNATFEAKYELESSGELGRLYITATIAEGWHVYSTTQPDGGPLKTKIELLTEGVERSGPFVPDHAPHISSNEVWPGLPIEEHHGVVTWTAPFKVLKSIDTEATKLELSVDTQVCTDGGSCIPMSEKLTAKYAGSYVREVRPETFRVDGTQATWSAQISPAELKPGGLGVLSLKAKLDEEYHLYPFLDEETEYRTVIVATQKSGLRFGAPQTKAELLWDKRLETPIAYHDGDVTWQIPIKIPDTAQAGTYPLELQVGFVTCNERACSARSAISVQGEVNVSPEAAAAPSADSAVTPLSFAKLPYLTVVDRPSLTDWIDQGGSEVPTKVSAAGGAGLEMWMVFAALAGGFILNFMPCVLPVIGLKLMSFVNQSGSSHAKVISLNLSYVVGILSVMLVLALANVIAKTAGDAFGWGQQFTRLEFQVPMAVLIFAMALSFLGVWEIPIPGFATSNKSGKLMEQEGLTGAFFKGILTTLLATPCSGPFLGTLFGLTLTLSITSIVLLYLLVGVGLGLPYLAICFYPQAIKLLPKPGAWMDTLKQVLAFPLLLTVVYFIAMIAPDYRVATLTLLIVVWFACWMIGRVPAYAEAYRIRSVWLTGVGICVAGTVLSFMLLGPVKHDVPWIPYNEAALAQHRSEGKTVMIEFTARWCLTCQSNMKFAIDRPRVANLVDENGVVPLLADWSEPSDEIFSKIKELNSLSIPLLAIYPADPTLEPIILRDAITETQLLEALKAAGPSQSKTKLTGVVH